jgi:hypothetical protein
MFHRHESQFQTVNPLFSDGWACAAGNLALLSRHTSELDYLDRARFLYLRRGRGSVWLTRLSPAPQGRLGDGDERPAGGSSEVLTSRITLHPDPMITIREVGHFSEVATPN